MAAQPYGWKLDLTGSATVDRDTSVVFSGVAALKYQNPDNATNGGWHGVQTQDKALGAVLGNTGEYCLALRPGATYRVKAASRTNRIAGGQKYRIKVVHDAGATIVQTKEFAYRVVDQWQVDEWTFTVPLTSEKHSTMYVEFSRNGDATATSFWLDSSRVVEQEVGELAGSELANSGREDLILNGDIENRMSWWGDMDRPTGGSFGYVGDGAISIDGSTTAAGLWAMKFSGTGTWAARAFQVGDVGDTVRGRELLVRVFPGDKLRVRCSAKLSAASGFSAAVVFKFYTHNRTLDTESTYSQLTWTTETVFTEKEHTVNLSGAASIYYMSFSIRGTGTSTGSAWFDEIHVWRMKRTEDLWDNCITQPKIADDAVGSAELQRTAINRQENLGDITGSVTIDWSTGLNKKARLTGNVTFTFTNPPGDGSPCTLKLLNDGTAGRTVTWPGAAHFDNGVTPTRDTGANKISSWTFYYDTSSVYYGNMFGGNFS